jgi:hypothetical protein
MIALGSLRQALCSLRPSRAEHRRSSLCSTVTQTYRCSTHTADQLRSLEALVPSELELRFRESGPRVYVTQSRGMH